ncbi:UvrD-helicase domain-containing protein [Pokkaliibacter sp. CJK22405]|uniref:UvrD-helicase domain-containing protein n=1 Tax=Pokkaliibacter sp. CJK22405 TaxID=3384615 RepID=UPI0039855245
MSRLPLNWINRRYLRATSLEVTEEGLQAGERLLPIPEFSAPMQLKRGWLFDTLNWGDYRLRLFRQRDTKDWGLWLKEAQSVHVRSQLREPYDALVVATDQFESQMAGRQRYWRASQMETFLEKQQHLTPWLAYLPRLSEHGYTITESMVALTRVLAAPEDCRHTFNQALVKQQRQQFKGLFDQLGLVDEQQFACLCDEDNVLVLASAGTGKTTTLCAKAAWVVAAGLADPAEILILAFGKAAAEEVRERLASMPVPGLNKVQVHTFHGFGRSLMADLPGQSRELATLASEDEALARFVEDWLKEAKDDSRLQKKLWQWCQQFAPASQQRIAALEVKQVSTPEHAVLLNQLAALGIEAHHQPDWATTVSSRKRKGYSPLLYLPGLSLFVADLSATSLDEEAVQALHAEDETDVCCIDPDSTTEISAQLLEALKARAKALKQPWKSLTDPQDLDTLLLKAEQAGYFRPLRRLLITALNRQRDERLDLKALARETDDARLAAFIPLLEALFKAYQQHLKSQDEIDFNDMIQVATRQMARERFHKDTHFKYRYRYVLVDEFQDISRPRAELLRAMKQAMPEMSLFAVGDDWQSIYRFNGGDVHLTYEFAEFFGPTVQCQLGQTFRFSDAIGEVAEAFIRQNPAQIPKSLSYQGESLKAQVYIVEGEKSEVIERVLAQLESACHVLMLARQRRSMPVMEQWQERYPQLKLEFMTLHKSKGSQADVVILLDVTNTELGIPSRQRDDALMDAFLPDKEDFDDAEERRLFYVGLTRARSQVVIQTEAGQHSPFIKELKKIVPRRRIGKWL